MSICVSKIKEVTQDFDLVIIQICHLKCGIAGGYRTGPTLTWTLSFTDVYRCSAFTIKALLDGKAIRIYWPDCEGVEVCRKSEENVYERKGERHPLVP